MQWAGGLVESKAEDYVFPACEAAGIERKHPDRERIDLSRPIKPRRSNVQACRFDFDLRHTSITKLAGSQVSEQALVAISGHVSRRMIEHYSHIRMDAKRTATGAIVDGGVNQNVNQPAAGVSRTSAKLLNGGPGWT
jgi:integrase